MAGTTKPNDETISYSEHRIHRKEFSIYARDYPGDGPAFVLMHGFPDNLHIYDSLAPMLAHSGRRVVAFDFLGYGGSDRPREYPYTAANLEGDISAVVNGLRLDRIVPVAHDASGPAAINWALAHPEQLDSLVLLNTYYDSTPSLRFPEFISLFADPAYADLAREFASDPAQLAWLLSFQGRHFLQGASQSLQENAQKVLFPIIQSQFGMSPSVMPAFMGLTRDLHSNLEANAQRIKELSAFTSPVSIIWGAGDPYLNPGVAQHLHSQFPTSELTLLRLGHWPQIDGPADVCSALFSRREGTITD